REMSAYSEIGSIMQPQSLPIRYLLSLPPGTARAFAALTGYERPQWFAGYDPVETKLGSGGGTASLLHAAYLAEEDSASFAQWLRRTRKLILHGGGQSRRLPAYAALGKPLIPIPVAPVPAGQ